jgi:hypothetical protein
MLRVAGILLFLILLGVYGWLLWQILRRPFRALGVLVAGMAVHNFAIMLLLRLNTPHSLIHLAQAWKEALVIILVVLALRAGLDVWRTGWRPRLLPMDIAMVAFAAVALVYFVFASQFTHLHLGLGQRLVGLRIVLFIPALYLIGRSFAHPRREDLLWSAWAIAGAGAAVGLFGVIELWLVPTRDWLNWGVNLFSAWLGFHYPGPFGLPPNFFQTTAEGFLLRRSVSLFISPLGIAYTGLLVVPIAAMLVIRPADRPLRWPWVPWLLLALTIVGIMFSVTRLAVALVVVEFGFLFLLRRRRWLAAAVPITGVLLLFVYFLYPQVGPLVNRNLDPIRHHGRIHIIGGTDTSLSEHSASLAADLQYAIVHPLGTGLGSSINRLGPTQGTGESAIFDMFIDLGVVGGALYVLLYVAAIVYGALAFLRRPRDAIGEIFPLVAFIGGIALFPITLTSDVWGDFSITFLFWWAAGMAVSVANEERISQLAA